MKVWSGVFGLVFVALLVVSAFIVPSSPDTHATAAKVIAYYHNHNTRLRVSAYLIEVADFLVASGLAIVRARASLSAGLGWLGIVVDVAALVISWICFIGLGVWILLTSIAILVRANRNVAPATS